MRTLVMAIATMTTFATNALAENRFAYNYEVNNDQVTTQYVYRVEEGKTLEHHLKYDYTYDEQGRITRKEALKWNDIIDAYEPYYCMDVNYTSEGTELQLGHWDEQTADYSANRQRTLYLNDLNGLNYLSYQWCEQTGQWLLQVDQSFSNEVQLLAEHPTETEN